MRIQTILAALLLLLNLGCATASNPFECGMELRNAKRELQRVPSEFSRTTDLRMTDTTRDTSFTLTYALGRVTVFGLVPSALSRHRDFFDNELLRATIPQPMSVVSPRVAQAKPFSYCTHRANPYCLSWYDVSMRILPSEDGRSTNIDCVYEYGEF